jgi:putative ABC transport system permease protein
MGPFSLILKSMRAYGLRHAVNVALVGLAFALFAMALELSQAFSAGTRGTGGEQLIVMSKLSQASLLPIRMADQLRALPQVDTVSTASWFGGYYREPKNAVPLFAIDARWHFKANRNLLVDPAVLGAWQSTRNGLLLGRGLAARFNIKPGQRFNLSSYLWTQANGSRDWDFVVVGLYDVRPGSGNAGEAMFMHYDYLNLLRGRGKDLVNVFIVRVRDERNSMAVARRIDFSNANSPYETTTSNAAQLAETQLSKVLKVNKILLPLVLLVLGVTFCIVCLNVSNNIRERLSQFAILKAIGFGNGAIYVAASSEILLLFLAGALLGLGADAVLWNIGAEGLAVYLPSLKLGADAWFASLALALVLSLAGSLIPAWHIRRINMTDHL